MNTGFILLFSLYKSAVGCMCTLLQSIEEYDVDSHAFTSIDAAKRKYLREQKCQSIQRSISPSFSNIN
jgi:hypothetical protein